MALKQKHNEILKKHLVTTISAVCERIEQLEAVYPADDKTWEKDIIEMKSNNSNTTFHILGVFYEQRE